VKPVLNIAHRGASGHTPENTLAALQEAIKMGADMIEIDLRLSRDGEWVVIHDRSTFRTTGKRGKVGRLPLNVLKALDAGSWFNDRCRGERIPTLPEVLNLVGHRARLNIEIKKGLRIDRRIEKRLLACLEAGDWRNRVLISSFNESMLKRLRGLDEKIPIGYLFRNRGPKRIIRRALKLGADSVHGPIRAVTPRLLQLAHSEGLKVFVYTVNEERAMRRWIDLGVDGIFTNYPDRLATVLKGRG
jgi:glycerophosphoryl diester phosphodiesterase